MESSPHLPIHPLSLALLPALLPLLEGRSEPVQSAEKGMDSLDDSLFPHKGGALKGGEPNISRFFPPLPPQFSFSSLLGVFSWNFGGV